MALVDDLHTGASSNAFGFGNEVEPDTNVDAVSQQEQLMQQLLPSVEHYHKIFDEEIAAVSDIRGYIKELGPNPNSERVQAEYRGRELYIKLISNLKAELNDRVMAAERETS